MSRDSSKPQELSDGLKKLTDASAQRQKASMTPTLEQLEQRRDGALRSDARKVGLIATQYASSGVALWRLFGSDRDLRAEGLTIDEAERFVRTSSNR